MSALSIVINNILLTLALAVSFFAVKSEALSANSLQIIAFCVIIFFTVQVLSKHNQFVRKNKSLMDFLLITLVVYIIIFSTGGLVSPVFFLNYFLLFAITLTNQPYASLSLATISSIFLLLNPRQDIYTELLQLSSLFMITPFALIFASQYKKIYQNEQEIEYLKKEENILLKEVVAQESQVKNWTAKEFKQRLIKIWENLEKVSSDSSITAFGKQKLKEISNQLANLLKSADEMEKKIEK
jgi:hypothetical protein